MSQAISNLMRLAKMGLQVTESIYVSDLWTKPRTWRERLFSWPWRPWVKIKTVSSPRGYLMPDGSLIVSPDTKRMLEEALLNDRDVASYN